MRMNTLAACKFSNQLFPSFVAETASITIEIEQSPAVFNNAIQSTLFLLLSDVCRP